MNEEQKQNYEKVEAFLTNIFCRETEAPDMLTAFGRNLRREYLGEA